MSSFYSDPAVRQRLVEYLGGDSLEEATAVYITHCDGCLYQRSELRPSSELQWFLDRDLDIARSLADHSSLLLHLDIEYVNFDAPGAAFVDPWRAFDLQAPVVQTIETLLAGWGIRPLHIITGQGHHFVWRVRADSEVADALTRLDPSPELTPLCMVRATSSLTASIRPETQQTFAGLALIIEFLAHCIKRDAAPRTEVPVEITAVHVGPCRSGQREMISIDISEYGDPLHTRMIRMPFTHYLKPWITGLARNLGIDHEVPRVKSVPLHEMDVRQALKCRQSHRDMLDIARRSSTRIPCQETGTQKLFNAYLQSSLRAFHQHYYSTLHDPPETWDQTYHRTPLAPLPPCARLLLQHPNDRLLKPAGMQLLTRALLAEGWHPRHIAGLIRAHFEAPHHGWGVDWSDYEPATRADFYTRLFAGLWAAGIDQLVDFNCTSTQEKGFCPSPDHCPHNLENQRHTLLTPDSP